MLRLVSLAGLCVLLGLCYALSRNRRAVSWRLVGMGLLLQVVLGGVFLYWDAGNRWLQGFGDGVKRFLDLAQRGTEFVFGDLARASSPRDLYLFSSADGLRFEPAGMLAAGASAPSFAGDAGGRLVAAFEWHASDLPPEARRLAIAFRGADGRWSPPRDVTLGGPHPGVGAPFAPCLVRLRDGRLRLYFAAFDGARDATAIWSAVSTDEYRFALEAGPCFAAAEAPVADPAVVEIDGTWHLYAPVRGAPGTASHATSRDGLRFEAQADLVLPGAGPWRGSAVPLRGGGVRFYGNGWAARSVDGATWIREDAFRVRDGNVVDPGVAALADGTYLMALPGRPGLGFVFATQVAPTLIFFAALMSVLYHLGVLQVVVRAMAFAMVRLLGTSGAESLSVCADVFVGQTEAPLVVRSFLPRMTMSELHAVMTGGFATIAGGVFAIYVGFGIDPAHLMAASVMAAPAALVCSKLLWPETEASETMGRVVRSDERGAGSVVEAAANGAADGLRLALNVAAMLIAFLGLIAVLDWLLGHFGGLFGDDTLSLGRVLGWVFSPIAAVMGVPAGEITALGQLLGIKLAATELIAYQQLAALQEAQALSPRTILIASFALCGFANFGSVAIQIGGLGALAPERKADVARLALRAMVAGSIATCMTACLAGALREA